jgi:hypothetical protein
MGDSLSLPEIPKTSKNRVMEATMPVVEFALDPTTQYRIQIHIPTEQSAYTVMFNRSVLGFLATTEEQRTGKYFVLPDRSNLYVRIEGRSPQVFRNSRLLTPLTEEELLFDASPAAQLRKPGERLLARIKKVAGMAGKEEASR